MAITRFVSQVMTAQTPSAGARVVTTEQDTSAATIVDGVWVYTTVNASGLAGTPAAGGRFVVEVLPRGTVPSGSGAVNHDNDILCRAEHPVSRDGAYEWADFFNVRLPRYHKFAVVNLTDQAVANSGLNMSVEYVRQT